MYTTEKEVQNSIFTTLVMQGWLVLRINGGALRRTGGYIPFVIWQCLGFGGRKQRGVSDLLAFRDGVLLAIECKSPKDRKGATDDQSEFIRAVKRVGGIGIVTDDPLEVDDLLERINP